MFINGPHSKNILEIYIFLNIIKCLIIVKKQTCADKVTRLILKVIVNMTNLPPPIPYNIANISKVGNVLNEREITVRRPP